MFTSIGGSSGIDIASQGVNDTITTSWQGAVVTAGVGFGVASTGGGGIIVVTFITLFKQVFDSVSTARPQAVHTADGSGHIQTCIAVEGTGDSDILNTSNTVVALLIWLEASITTFWLARTSAARSFPPHSFVASFSKGGISNTISAIGFDAGGAADSSSEIGRGSVALLTVLVVDDVISALGELAVGSATVGGVSVGWALVTLLSTVGVVSFGSVVTALASPSGWESRKNFGKEGIITDSTAVVKDGNGSLLGS